ncbi:prepilin-type N-terminal cleavage/methylation domain-containing protein [Stomatohabitans albus]|uniref:type IV pilus modification PilV family protein n=1 Tax=Stomatohabitans albus TaxID=3110766 RepID=UPI00300D0430
MPHEAGISLMEVVVSMVILSIVLSMVATVVVTSVRQVIRSDAGITAATIAQDSIERLLTVPVSRWAFDSNGKVKRKRDYRLAWGDGRAYRIEREIEPVSNIYELRDACDTVIGKHTSASDLIKVTVTVTPSHKESRDRYTTSFLLSRDDDSIVTESSLTVKFNVYDGINRTPYKEAESGPIRVVLRKGTTTEQAGLTKKGCVTFIGINEPEVPITFVTKNFTETLSQKSDYFGNVTLVPGGNRLVKYDLTPKRQVMVIPQMVGATHADCVQPRLLRMRTPIRVGEHRGIESIDRIARRGEEGRAELQNKGYLTHAEEILLDSSNKWQYYMQCKPKWDDVLGETVHFNYLLPDTIPISLVEQQGTRQTIRPLATWADGDFHASEYAYVEEADWPIVELPRPKRGVAQRLVVGSCIMSGSDRHGAIKTVDGNTEANWKPDLPFILRLPMWPAAIDGVDRPERLFDYNSTYSVVVKNIYDIGDDARFGSHQLRSENKRDFSGCTDTPPFHLGWLSRTNLRGYSEQLLVAFPYGLYTYDFYAPTMTEVNEAGQTAMRARSSCSLSCINAQGEKECIRAGAERHELFDLRGVYTLSGYRAGNNYLDWFQRNQLNVGYYIGEPRGPVLEGCALE